jgi:glycerol-3-phosphate acyltransferase PlsY
MNPAVQMAALLVSYLLGSIPTAYIVVKRLKRVDVRTVGSGNVGATNVVRAAGAKAGAFVFLMDVAKGLAAVCVVAPWMIPSVSPLMRLGCGVAAVLGHSFPVFLGFRGGKGVATTIGVIMGASPLVGLVCLAVWLVFFLPCRYVSVGSLAAAGAIPLAQLALQRSFAEVWLGGILALVVILRHRANIERLLQGKEHRIGRHPQP